MTALVVLAAVLAAELATLGGAWLYRSGRPPEVVNVLAESPGPVEVALRPDPDPEREQETSWMRGLVMETVIVHTDAGLSYEGLLVLEHEKGIILRNPKLLDENRAPTPMAGELWLAKEKVHGVQTKPLELTQLPSAS